MEMISLFFRQSFPALRVRLSTDSLKDRSRYDTKTHQLRDGISKEQARAILLVASHIALKCGFKLILTSEERKLMGKKFKQ